MKTDEQAIRDLHADWHRFTEAGDLPRILELMDENVVFLRPGRPPMKGRKEFAEAFRMALSQAQLKINGELQEIQVSGELAYSWTHLTVTITPLQSGQAMQRIGNVLNVLRKLPDGKWVLLRDANMLDPATAL